MRVFHFVIKKRKRALRPDSFFFLMILTFFKSILILIITSLAIHYSQNVFRGFSILVCIGVQVFFRGFIFHSSSRTWLALALASRLLPLYWKIAPVLQIQSSSMKLRVHGFLFLVFLRIKTDGKNKLFLLPHQHSVKKVFLGVSQEWKLWKILPDNNPNWNEHSFSGLLPGDVS